MAQKLIACKACGKEISSSAKTCPHCGARNTKPIYKKWWFWTIIAVIFFGIVGGSNSQSETSNTGTVNTPSNEQSPTSAISADLNVFSGDCGISAIAEMGSDIIGQPTVTVSIQNTSDKDINAIKFYAVPLNVYGEEIKGIWAQNELYTDNTIVAGGSDSCTWQFLEDEVKSVKLYVYSVYFSDGTEWGNKDATKSVILKNGLEIEVNGVS